tara:strand:+ start:1195 stop:1686 length:492 start_codon:yes stop_codon:yes gene_type:complete
MGLNIPTSVFNKLNEAILLFNRTCTLVYPEKKERCINCFTNTIGGRSVNSYRSGGPVSFNRGSLCPLCGGEGFKNVEFTKDVELRVYYNRKEFIDVGVEADIPSNVIQTVGLMSDYADIMKAKELLVSVGSQNQGRYKRISEPYPQGFKQNPTQYVVIFWERV